MSAVQSVLFAALAVLLSGCIDPGVASSPTCEASGRNYVACALICKRGERLEAVVLAEADVQVSISSACGGSLVDCFGSETCGTEATHRVGADGEGHCIGGFPGVLDRWRTLHVMCRSAPADFSA